MNLGCGLFGAAYEIEKDMWGSFKKYRDAGFTAVEPFYGRKSMVLDSSIPSHLRSIIWREQEVAEYQPRLRELTMKQ